MRGSKVEQLGVVHGDGFRQFVDIETATEGGDLRRHALLAERNRPPLETLACEHKNVTLIGAHQKKYKCFVGAKQVLHLFGGKRLSMCERGIGCVKVRLAGSHAAWSAVALAEEELRGARAHQLDCRRGRGLTGPLGDFEGLVSERRRRLNSLACRNG